MNYPQFSKKNQIPTLILILGSLITILLRLPYLHSGFLSSDEGIYGCIGQAVYQGKVMFHTAFDHKSPGFFFSIPLLSFSVMPLGCLSYD